jgi:hypothetical protein
MPLAFPPILRQFNIQQQLLKAPSGHALVLALTLAHTSRKLLTREHSLHHTTKPNNRLARGASYPKSINNATPKSTIRSDNYLSSQRGQQPEVNPQANPLIGAQLEVLQALAKPEEPEVAQSQLLSDMGEFLAMIVHRDEANRLDPAYEHARLGVALPLLTAELTTGEKADDLLHLATLYLGLIYLWVDEIDRKQNQLEPRLLQLPSRGKCFHGQLALGLMDCRRGLLNVDLSSFETQCQNKAYFGGFADPSCVHCTPLAIRHFSPRPVTPP